MRGQLILSIYYLKFLEFLQDPKAHLPVQVLIQPEEFSCGSMFRGLHKKMPKLALHSLDKELITRLTQWVVNENFLEENLDFSLMGR